MLNERINKEVGDEMKNKKSIIRAEKTTTRVTAVMGVEQIDVGNVEEGYRNGKTNIKRHQTQVSGSGLVKHPHIRMSNPKVA